MEVAFLFIMIVALMLVGVPIGVSLGISSITFLLVFSDTGLAPVAHTLFDAIFSHTTLMAIPFFILASSFMSTGGVAKRIIRFANATVGHFRGGLGMASVLACMLFAALSGSSPATVVAVGSISIAAMVQNGYTKDFAAGIIANAGTLGILIPPSIVMVVYASATDTSIQRLFMAGVIPGLIAGGLLMLGIYIFALIRKLPKGQFVGWDEFFGALLDASWGLFLMVVILGGIYGGVFTPTEAAAVASVYALVVALFIYRDMGPLKSKPWIIESERPAALLGARVIGFSIATTLLWVLLGSMYLAEVGEDAKFGMIHVLIASGLFTVLCLALGALFAHFARSDHKNTVTLVAILIIGVLPALYVGYVVLINMEHSLGLTLLVVFLAMFATLIPPAMMLYAYASSADDLASTGHGYLTSLALGAKNIGRGISEAVLWVIPASFHKESRTTIFDAAKLTIMLMFIIANALILKHVLTDEQIPQQIAGMITDAGFGKIMFLLMVNIILLIGGQFMEPSGLIVIVAPLVFPIAMQLGIDPVHLGIIMVVNMEIGMITPPVGLNLFVTSGVAGMPMLAVVRAALPWLMILIAFLVLVTYVPAVSIWLPTEIYGPEIINK